ncbi:beta-1,3-galactosyltransferase 1-like [Physella acuta]|uniref:beta-1,3-galactosyltransferase 1-like n=1 Tax=Physella acuta TaxID=109671 RepID=UPI0027DC45CD|nr:beta-1,3-galactosyltransferase 1-like [Physella acuta]
MHSLGAKTELMLRYWLEQLSKKRWADMGAPLSREAVWRTLTGSLLVMAVCVTVWQITTPSTEVITLSLTSDNETVRAIFKHVQRNADGSIDFLFNVPRDEPPTVQPDTSTARPVVRLSYPLTLDSPYLINSVNLCPPGWPIDYIIVVHSAIFNYPRRRIIRETYGSARLFGLVTQRVVFLLGQTGSLADTRLIQEEAMTHKDIVQGRFLDSYHNLTHKGVLGYRWVSEHCPQAKFVIKIDDDVFLNPFKLVQEVLPRYQNKSRQIACHVRRIGASVVVRGKGKWVVHEDEFRGQRAYPFEYCNGYFVILTGDLIRPLFRAARINPFFWIDDVYLFGILPATVGGTTFSDLRPQLTLSFNVAKPCFVKDGAKCRYLAVSQWRADEPETLWYLLLSNITKTVKRELIVHPKF